MRGLAVIFFACCMPLQAVASDAPESLLLNAFDAFASGQQERASSLTESLLAKHKNFRLANMLQGDLLAVNGLQLPLFNAGNQQAVISLQAEAQARWQHRQQLNDRGDDPLVPSNILGLARDYSHVFVFDLQASRLYLFQNTLYGPRLVRDYYSSIGLQGIGKQREGDKKTPLGVYRFVGHHTDDGLPERYGAGAYPINYPNQWDRYHKRSGSGIWLHGVSRDTYSRPPQDSDGCMVLSNEHLLEVGPLIQVDHTPVVLTPKIDWVPLSASARMRAEVLKQVERWRRAWVSRDASTYLKYYAEDFSNAEHTRKSWAQHKRRIADTHSVIDVKIKLRDIFIYPVDSSDRPIVLVEFEQDYRNDTLQSATKKQQFWRKEPDGRWRVIYEDNV